MKIISAYLAFFTFLLSGCTEKSLFMSDSEESTTVVGRPPLELPPDFMVHPPANETVAAPIPVPPSPIRLTTPPQLEPKPQKARPPKPPKAVFRKPLDTHLPDPVEAAVHTHDEGGTSFMQLMAQKKGKAHLDTSHHESERLNALRPESTHTMPGEITRDPTQKYAPTSPSGFSPKVELINQSYPV